MQDTGRQRHTLYPFRTKPAADRAGASTITHLGTPLCDRHWALAAAEPAAVQQ